MRSLIFISLGFIVLITGCLLEECTEKQEYKEIVYFNETEPYYEENCVNITRTENYTDYICSNFTYNETYIDRICEDKQIKYTFYSIIQSKVCDATYTPDVNWDPICLRGHYECRFKITNVDSATGDWTFGMEANVTNGSHLDLGDKTYKLKPGESATYDWEVKLESLDDNMTCNYRIVSIPLKKVCVDVPKNRTVTRQECDPVIMEKKVVEEKCEDVLVGYVTVEKNETITKYRDVSKRC